MGWHSTRVCATLPPPTGLVSDHAGSADCSTSPRTIKLTSILAAPAEGRRVQVGEDLVERCEISLDDRQDPTVQLRRLFSWDSMPPSS